MNDVDSCFLTIRELSDHVKNGDITPLELLELFYERCIGFDKALKALILLSIDQACATARRLEKEIRSGKYRGPSLWHSNLDLGQRFNKGNKDHFWLENIFNERPDFDATITEKMKEEDGG